MRATAVSGSEILGPVLAGILVAAAGAGWAIAVDASTFAMSAVCLSRLRPPATRANATSTSFLADMRDGWTAFRSRRWVWTFIAYFAIANMLWGAWSSLGPMVADRDLGGAAVWGTVLGARRGRARSWAASWRPRVRPRRPLLFVASLEGLFALPLAFLAAAAPAPLLAFGAFLSGIGMMLGTSVWESTLQRHIPAASSRA